jgi:Asp-tRNA(Asn)/Glu-tRNA(Gln) amidotransferase A subunit family amidase
MHIEALKEAWLPGIDAAPTGEAYFELVEELLAARKVHEKILRDNRIDALLYPSTKIPNTPSDGSNVMESKGPLGNELSELLIGANVMYSPGMRTPSISLFSGVDTAGLPLPVTFDALSGDDRKLLDVAEAIEKVLPRLVEPKSI